MPLQENDGLVCDSSFCGDFEQNGNKEQEELFAFSLPRGPRRPCRSSAPNTHQLLLCGPSVPRIYGLLRPAPAPRVLAGSTALVKQEKPLPQNVTTALLTNNSSVSAPQSTSIYFFCKSRTREHGWNFPLQKHMFSPIVLFWKKKENQTQTFHSFLKPIPSWNLQKDDNT